MYVNEVKTKIPAENENFDSENWIIFYIWKSTENQSNPYNFLFF